MNYNKVSRFFLIIFTISITLFSIVSSILRPKILVIQSYSIDSQRAEQFNAGLSSILDHRTDIQVNQYYMNSELLINQAALNSANQQALNYLAHAHADLVILMGDNAINALAPTLMRNSQKPFLYSNASIEVFKHIQAVPNARGLVERIEMAFFTSVLTAIFHQDYTNLRIISDDTPITLTINHELSQANWSPFHIQSITACRTLEEWKAAILAANETHSIVMIPRYRGLINKKGTLVPSQSIVQWTVKNSKNPIIGGSKQFVSEGGPIAIDVSSEEEGKTIGMMAISLLNKKIGISNIRTSATKNYLIFIQHKSYDQLYHHYPLPPLLKALANKMDGYYDE